MRVLTAVAYMSDLVGYRKSKGMNQAGLARFLEVSQATISRLENRIQGVGSQEALRLSRLTGLPLSAFIIKKKRRAA